jgi:hypothetical protein
MKKLKSLLVVFIASFTTLSCKALFNPNPTITKSATPGSQVQKPSPRPTAVPLPNSSNLIEKIEVPYPGLILNVGDSKNLLATANNTSGQKSGNLQWESSDNNIVLVTENGSVKAINEGSATLKVSGKTEPEKSYSIPVIVKDLGKSINRIDITPSVMILDNTGTGSATATLTNIDNTQDNRINWVILNRSIADVDSAGKVTARLEGETRLEAISAVDDSYKSSIKIIVRDNLENFVNTVPTVESINLKEKFFLFNLGESKTIDATVKYNLGRSDTDFQIESLNPEIISVDGHKISAIAEGKTRIRLYSHIEPNKSFYLPVIVGKLPVIISTVTASPAFQVLKEGESINIDARAYNNYKSENRNLQFNNLTPDILQLDNSSVKALKEGEGKIEITSQEDNSKKTMVNILVTKTDNRGPSKIVMSEAVVNGNVDNYSASLKWLKISSANNYQVYRNNKPVSTVNSDSWTDTNLKDPSYDYYVTACADKLCSAASNTIKVNIPKPLPVELGEPELKAGSSSYTLVLNWKQVPGATSYQVFKNNSSVLTTKDTSYFEPNFSVPFSDYYILACNQGGCSEPGNIKTVTQPVPNAPVLDKNIINKTNSLSDIVLKWSPVTGANYYTVLNNGKVVYMGAATTFRQNGLQDNFYEYFVSACNNSGCSAYQSTGSVSTVEKLPAPIINDPEATRGDNSKYYIYISWSEVDDIERYRLYKDDTLIYEGTATYFTEKDQDSLNHYYYVESCDGNGCTKSDTVKAKIK